MVYAIKSTYSVTTRCVLASGKRLSDIFTIYSGLKQGASPPSVIPSFIHIMLLHADDTVVFSTSPELFITKCNTLLSSFNANRLELNLKKSDQGQGLYLSIPKIVIVSDNKIKLKSEWLSYKKSFFRCHNI